MKFFPHSSAKQQSVTYVVVKDYILEKIQKEYKDSHDVVQSLRDLKLIDLDALKPVRTQSTLTDTKDQKFK